MSAVQYWRQELKRANKDIARLQKEHFDEWGPKEEAARRDLRGIATDSFDEEHSTLIRGSRVRARSEGQLDLRDTATSSKGSLTSSLLHNNDVSLHGGIQGSGHGSPRNNRRLSGTQHSNGAWGDAVDEVGDYNKVPMVMHPLNPFGSKEEPLR